MDLDFICLLIIIAIAYFVYITNKSSIQEKQKAKEREQQEKERAPKAPLVKMGELKKEFVQSLRTFFLYSMDSYSSEYNRLQKIIEQMSQINAQIIKTLGTRNEELWIRKFTDITSEFKQFGEKVSSFYTCRMINWSDYGNVNKEYWHSVRSLSREFVEKTISQNEELLGSTEFEKIFAIDLELALKCVWFFSTERPYSILDSQRAIQIFKKIYKKECIDITLAEFFAIKQMGGETVLRERVREMLKQGGSADKFILFASAFMWMKEYQAESMVLQHMLSKGMQMNAKAQERLHALSNGRGKAPAGLDVISSSTELYFDVSAITWKDDDYTGLFENLSFQDKILSYSLAIRDEDKELFITQEMNIPDLTIIIAKIRKVFSEEYGASVIAKLVNCNALSGCGEEKLTGILAISKECAQMGIFVHVAHIGKKLIIKFYTLFIPTETGNLSGQKQQVMSLLKRLSPAVTMWESSLKDTILLAIEQLLNAFQVGQSVDNSIASDEITFF